MLPFVVVLKSSIPHPINVNFWGNERDEELLVGKQVSQEFLLESYKSDQYLEIQKTPILRQLGWKKGPNQHLLYSNEFWLWSLSWISYVFLCVDDNGEMIAVWSITRHLSSGSTGDDRRA